MKDGFADKLRQVTSADQVIELFDQASEKAQEPVQAPANESGDFIVAVTACTTGIAHTYMAQEALQKWLRKWVLVSRLKQMVLAVLVTN